MLGMFCFLKDAINYLGPDERLVIFNAKQSITHPLADGYPDDLVFPKFSKLTIAQIAAIPNFFC